MKHLLSVILVLLMVSCGSRDRSKLPEQSEKPVVTTVNYPLYYFAQRICGELAQLNFPAPPGVDPAYWIPDDEALSLFQSSDIILDNGADYTHWLHHVSLPASRITNTSAGSKERYIMLQHGTSHSHGPEGEHEHTGYAFTTWLDFELAAQQAGVILETMIAHLPESREVLVEKHASLEKDLLELHGSMKEISGGKGGLHIIGSHPVYQYLASAYGLHINSVHFEPGEMPSDGQWKAFHMMLAQDPCTLMLWEDEPLPEVRALLEDSGISVVVFNPCGNRPPKGDFMDVMNKNMKGLQDGFSK